MSKQYWAEINKMTLSEEVLKDYQHLEALYVEYWKDRSILADINLSPVNQSDLKTVSSRVAPTKKKGLSINPPNLNKPKRISMLLNDDNHQKDLRKIIRKYQRKSLDFSENGSKEQKTKRVINSRIKLKKIN